MIDTAPTMNNPKLFSKLNIGLSLCRASDDTANIHSANGTNSYLFYFSKLNSPSCYILYFLFIIPPFTFNPNLFTNLFKSPQFLILVFVIPI